MTLKVVAVLFAKAKAERVMFSSEIIKLREHTVVGVSVYGGASQLGIHVWNILDNCNTKGTKV